MATAAQVIKYALQEIIVQASESPLEPDEYQDCIFALNSMMLEYNANGISLGFTEVTNLGDTLTVPAGAISGIVSNLALRVAPQFQGVVSQELMTKARDGYKVMCKLGVTIQPTQFGSLVPRGSGNYNDQTSNYYPATDDEIEAEVNNNIQVESST